MTTDGIGARVLLVDDLVDSGVTLDAVKRHIMEAHPAVTEIRTAVLWYKQCSKYKPDYYVEYLAENPWIHQPFEPYDLMKRRRSGRAHRVSAQARGCRRDAAGRADRGAGYVLRRGGVGGAEEGTRTPTVLPPLGPEPSASTNFATSARGANSNSITVGHQ